MIVLEVVHMGLCLLWGAVVALCLMLHFWLLYTQDQTHACMHKFYTTILVHLPLYATELQYSRL